MEFIAFAIAMAVAFQAMKGYRLARERTLLYLNFSFLLLGAGRLVDGLANLIVLLSKFHRNFLFLSRIGYTIDFLAQLVASERHRIPQQFQKSGLCRSLRLQNLAQRAIKVIAGAIMLHQ